MFLRARGGRTMIEQILVAVWLVATVAAVAFVLEPASRWVPATLAEMVAKTSLIWIVVVVVSAVLLLAFWAIAVGIPAICS